MAEGWARAIFSDLAWIESAGTDPTTVNTHTYAVMKEVGIDLSEHYAKSYLSLHPQFLEELDLVITLCPELKILPPRLQSVRHIHWPMPDPMQISEYDRLSVFRDLRDLIRRRMKELEVDLPENPRPNLKRRLTVSEFLRGSAPARPALSLQH